MLKLPLPLLVTVPFEARNAETLSASPSSSLKPASKSLASTV